MKKSFNITIDPKAPELKRGYKAPKVNDEFPKPTGYHWTIPKSYIKEKKHLEKIWFIHPKTGKRIYLNEHENKEWHTIYTWCLHFGKEDFFPDLYVIQKDILAFFIRFKIVVIEVFRGAGKTYIDKYIHAYYICEDPSTAQFLVGEEQTKTIARVVSVRNILVKDVVIEKYGYLIAQSDKKKKASDKSAAFTCIRNTAAHEPTLKAMSWRDQKSQGDHYKGGSFDDVWSVQLQEEKDAKKKFLLWYSSFDKTLEKNKWFMMLRTRKAVNDLYAELDKLHKWTKFTSKLVHKWPKNTSYKLFIDEESDKYDLKILNIREFYDHLLYGEDAAEIKHDLDKCSDRQLFEKIYKRGICQTRFDSDSVKKFELPIQRFLDRRLEYLLKQMKNAQGQMEDYFIFPKYSIIYAIIDNHRDPLGFAKEMQNQPFLPSGDLLKMKHAHFFDKANVEGDPMVDMFYKQLPFETKILIMDPARGHTESNASDYNVLLCMVYYRNRYWVIYAWCGRWDVSERRKVMRQARDMFPGAVMYIEEDFGQLNLIKDLVGPIPGLKLKGFLSKGKGQGAKGQFEDKGKRAAKLAKIYNAYYVKWADELIYINKHIEMLDDPDGLKQQIVSFPNCEYIDYMDCSAMGLLILDKRKGKKKGGKSRIGSC